MKKQLLPQGISIAALQKSTDQQRTESLNQWLKIRGTAHDTNPSLTAQLLEANGYGTERRCLSFHFDNNKVTVSHFFTWDGAFIAQLGNDSNLGAWGVAATIDEAERELLQELKQRMTPDGYLHLAFATAEPTAA